MSDTLKFLLPLLILFFGFFSLSNALWFLKEGIRKEYMFNMMIGLVTIFIITPIIYILLVWGEISIFLTNVFQR